MTSVGALSEARDSLAIPEPGQLVTVRDRRWVAADVKRATIAGDVPSGTRDPQHLVHLVSVEDDAPGEELRVIWEIEPGRRVTDRAALPEPRPDQLDPPERLDAFLDAVRWGAIASADARHLQSPFRAGVRIEDYQLDPVVRALRMPRVNLLIADDTGLGKTIEAGLVVQELLLRHRVRTVLVVCPASLCLKWRDEMRDKFGLEFRIVNRDLLRDLRRTRGLHVNPFTHFPRLIISIDYLKRDHVMRLMREVLPARPEYPRAFDLLIVDEAHGIAPAGRGRYATDSLRTRAVRTIAPHFEHRLFLTATPHNGYRESFSALLELLDDRRFARGVQWSEEQLHRVMVRRLKSELPGFPTRKIIPLEVEWSEEEREAYAKLKRYGELRREAAKAGDEAARLAERFVFALLKRRFFSSPAAFAETLTVHRDTVTREKRTGRRPKPGVLREAFEEVHADHGDEEEQRESTTDALVAAAEAGAPLTAEQRSLLDALIAWAEAAQGRPDSKAEALMRWLDDVVRPPTQDGSRRWSDERVIIFTEYRDTQRWLHEQLAARGLAGERLALLHGGMDEKERERIKAQFQASPEDFPVRILLATDAASEGIDLQRHCHRLVHYEIPWNPNRLEQRNGRIDRYGQPSPEVLVHHFVSAGYATQEPGSLEGDLEFLYQAAQKVEAIREDLGSVGPVIAEQVEEAMLGMRRTLDTAAVEKRAVSKRALRIERDVRAEVAKLRERLAETIAELAVNPERVERAVRVALELARQPDLIEQAVEHEGRTFKVFALPPLTGSWARAVEGLPHPATQEVRPITFDQEAWATLGDGVVLAHLHHVLVQQSLRLLRAEIWATDAGRLSRVTARSADPGTVPVPVVVAHGRLVITGADGHRLHEEVIEAGGALVDGRFRRLRVTDVGRALSAASDDPPGVDAVAALIHAWPGYRQGLLAALEVRARDRAESLRRALAERAEDDVRTITHVLEELRATIAEELREPEHEQLALFTPDEREQFERDVEALRRRLDRIPADIEEETRAIRRRYADPEPRLFPAAVTFLVPKGWRP